MDITVTLVPEGNTTQRELASLTADSAEALRGLREVQQVAAVRGVAPEGAKGVFEEAGKLLVSMAPTAVTAAFGVLRGVLARSDTPTKVKFSADGGMELEFDPRHTTTDQMAALVLQLRPAPARG